MDFLIETVENLKDYLWTYLRLAPEIREFGIPALAALAEVLSTLNWTFSQLCWRLTHFSCRWRLFEGFQPLPWFWVPFWSPGASNRVILPTSGEVANVISAFGFHIWRSTRLAKKCWSCRPKELRDALGDILLLGKSTQLSLFLTCIM